ncbi:MAG: S8 family serine peptidase [Balneolaceae bacterium]|nr:S8 family serine peptidase [Balneolaceae bacterium]
MKNKLIKFLGAFLILAVGAFYGCDQPLDTNNADQPEEQTLNNGDPIPDQYIVVFKDNNTQGKVAKVNAVRSKVLSENSIAKERVLSEYNRALQGFTAKLDKDQVEKLRLDKRVDYIEQDRVITLAPPGACSPWPGCRDDDEEDDGGDDGGDSNQTTPYGITRVGGPVASSGTAWVIDSGIDLDHPDLNVDTDRSAVFVSRGPGSGTPDDGNGHGTHVAGTIAALDNDIDVVGVAAGASVVAVKVLDDRGSGSYSNVINGIDYVASNASAGDVANMSLGGGTSDAVDDAVRNAADQGILFSIAAGNSSDDANNYSPARVEYNNVWTVSAIDDTDTFASFSNYSGPTDPPIEFAAPGVRYLSLWAEWRNKHD